MSHTSADELLASIDHPRERSLGVKLLFALLLLTAFEWSMCDAMDQAATEVVEAG